MNEKPSNASATQQLLHELQVHQVELENQNEELRRAQAELDALRARYFDLYDLAPIGYLTLGDDGRILESNLTAATLLGVPRGTLERKPLSQFIVAADQDVFYRHQRELEAAGRPQSCELRMRTSDDTPLWLQLSSSVAEGPLGVRVQRTALSDVTERKLLELQSEHQRDVFALVASGGPLLEVLGGIVTKYEAKLHGMKGCVVLLDADGKQRGPVIAPSFPPTLYAALEQGVSGAAVAALRTRRTVVVDDLATDARAGAYQDSVLAHGLHAWSTPILGTSSAVLGVLTFYFEAAHVHRHAERALIERAAHLLAVVLERHAFQQELEERRAFNVAILDSVTAEIAVLDSDGTIAAVNEPWRRFARENAVERGKPAPNTQVGANYLAACRESVVATDEHTLTAYEGIQAVLDDKLPSFSLEYPCHSPSEERWYSMSVTPLGSGERSRVVVTHTNITDRVHAAEERLRLEAQLQQASKMQSIGRLAGGVAHDFNNLLGVIVGHVELLMDGLGPEAAGREDLEAINTAAHRSIALTRQLLAFARQQVVASKVVDLNKTLGAMLGMITRLVGEDVRVGWRPAPDLWRIKIDPSQVDQIITNLCVNARDAIADGGAITIETSNCVWPGAHDSAPGDYVRIVVSDDGVGMSEEVLAHAFEPFYTTKSLGKGTGLGLATVYGAVQQNHGFIVVESKPALGTRVAIHLPRHGGEVEHAPSASVAPSSQVSETILLVEDEPAILALTVRLLKGRGYTVLKADGPEAALELARRHVGDIHLLVTDVVMPGMNGRDLADLLTARFPKLRRLFMSGYTADVIAPRGVLAEGTHFVQKPFSKAELIAKVRAALDS